MKEINFIYWLQGFLEMSQAAPNSDGSITLSKEQVEVIRKHMRLVNVTNTPLYRALDEQIKTSDLTVIC